MVSFPPRRITAFSAFDAQSGSVGGYVRAGFVDDGDDAKRHAAFFNPQAVGPAICRDCLADRIGLRGDGFQPAGHGFDSRIRKRQAVQHGL